MHLYGGPYPFVQTGDVTASGGRISEYKQTYSQAGFEQSRLWPAKTMCITIAANIAETGVLQFDACFPDSVVGFIADPTIANVYFVEYMFRTLKREIQNQATGSVQDNINLATLARLQFSLPSLIEQKAIAEVLGALDDKIAANTVKSRTASTLGMTYFSSLLDSAEDVHRSLGDFTTIVLGGTPARDVPEYWLHGQVPWLNSGEANLDRILYPSDHITKLGLAKSASKMMPIGATLVAITGATLGQIARLEINACGNQSLIGIWAQDEATTNWVHFAVRSEISELLKKATGAAQQHVNKADVERMQIPMVSLEKRQSFNLLIGPLLKVAAEADRESAQLAATRDALLPQLMSGKLRVRDAEKAVEAVV